MLYREQTFSPRAFHSELQQQTNTVNTQKSLPWACDKGCAEGCAERFSALKVDILWRSCVSLGTTQHGCTKCCTNCTNACTMSDEDGLAQLVSSYASDKSSSEDEQLEVIKYKTDQCDESKTKDLKDGNNVSDNINNAGARWVVCDMLKPASYTDKQKTFSVNPSSSRSECTPVGIFCWKQATCFRNVHK